MSIITDIPDLTTSLTVVINEDTEHSISFVVPESFLTEKSEFFKAACRNEWKEATSRVVKLPEVDVDTFNSYLFWVYKEKIAIRDGSYLEEEGDRTSVECMARGGAIHTSLVKLWVLADRLADVRLRNATADKLAFGLELDVGNDDNLLFFPPALTTYVWSSTTANRPLRRLALDYYNGCIFAHEIKPRVGEFQAGFLGDLMVAALQKTESVDKGHYSPREMIKRTWAVLLPRARRPSSVLYTGAGRL